MSLAIEEFDINELRAGLGNLLHEVTGEAWHGMRFVNFYYGNDCHRVPNIGAYGGKFGQFFELDLKDEETEEFFKSLGETIKDVGWELP